MKEITLDEYIKLTGRKELMDEIKKRIITDGTPYPYWSIDKSGNPFIRISLTRPTGIIGLEDENGIGDTFFIKAGIGSDVTDENGKFIDPLVEDTLRYPFVIKSDGSMYTRKLTAGNIRAGIVTIAAGSTSAAVSWEVSWDGSSSEDTFYNAAGESAKPIVILTLGGESDASEVKIFTSNVTNSGFTANVRREDGKATIIHYFAIGYNNDFAQKKTLAGKIHSTS
jgi:hypothetical protein